MQQQRIRSPLIRAKKSVQDVDEPKPTTDGATDQTAEDEDHLSQMGTSHAVDKSSRKPSRTKSMFTMKAQPIVESDSGKRSSHISIDATRKEAIAPLADKNTKK